MRSCGILMPVFSLPTRYGIGTFGREAYRFVDFLEQAGQSVWQVLPLGPAGFGNSPYSSLSAMAGNPLFIDLEMLCEQNLLERSEIESVFWGADTGKVDYAAVCAGRFPLLRKACDRFLKARSCEFDVFCRFHAKWLDDYALFMAIKDSLSGAALADWPDDLRLRDPAALQRAEKQFEKEIRFYQCLQFFFAKQWAALKGYANKKGIRIFGDLPIYASADSADVWANPQIFQLDADRRPRFVAGTPPDAFSATGQRWGNPLYDWDALAATDYAWWTQRLAAAFKWYDLVRIDHFRAFSAYFSIPAAEDSAVNGTWVTGPGMAFFDAMRKNFGTLPVVAEDLGTLDEPVRALLEATGFPGMKVLQFAFEPDDTSDYLPHNIGKNCVVYTGTHDNDTALGWSKDGNPAQVAFARTYLRIGEQDSFNWELMRAACATAADTVILQMQDFLGLDNRARMNTPGVPDGNWVWRIDYSCANPWLAGIIREMVACYRRLPPDKK